MDNMGYDYEELQNPKDNLIKMLNEINWHEVDFLINTGDLVHDEGVEGYRLLKEIYKNHVPEKIPILNIMGNHDNQEAYKKVFNKESTSFVKHINGYRLIGLNIFKKKTLNGYLEEDEKDFLKTTLAKNYGSGSLLFIHSPIIWDQSIDIVIENSKELLEIIKNSDIRAIFCGHSHESRILVTEEILQFTGTSSFFSMRINEEQKFMINNSVGYAEVEVENGQISYLPKTLDIDPITVFDF